MKRLIIITIWFLSLSVQAQLPVYLDATKPFEERVDDMLQRMTAAEKQTLASTCMNLRSSGVPRLGIQPFVADTLPHAGMPSFAALTASWNPDLARQLGHTVAEQARYNRIDAIADATWGQQGEDPYIVSKMAPLYPEGVRSCGVAVMEDLKGFANTDPSAQETLLRQVLQLYLQTSMNEQRPMGFLGTEEQASTLRTIATESVVLLKNDNGFLPLKNGASCRIWMVGSHPVEGLQEALEQQGIHADCEQGTFEEVAGNAGTGDIVVFTENCSDRTGTGFLKKVPAVLQTDDLGAEGANALAAILSGEADPSGKLPYTWQGGQEKEPLFALGHGLSYTTFELSDIAQSGREIPVGGELYVTVTVTNTGDREGSEVVQLYIHDIKTSLPKPDKTLQGFQKVTLKPGESQEVSFPINESSLLFFDEETQSWIAEPGFYVAYVGTAMNHTPLKVRFHLK